jgi:AcrR family transcriptional regulator
VPAFGVSARLGAGRARGGCARRALRLAEPGAGPKLRVPMALGAREKILKAALREFAKRGFAGTRVDSIASRARVNKQLIYYYFGNKRALYEELARTVHAEREAAIAEAPEALADNLAYWLGRHADDPEYLRLLMWESLEGAGATEAEDARKHFWAESLARARRSEQSGAWPDSGGETGQALLCWLGAVMFPLAFPQLTRLITGRAPDEKAFLRAREAYLRAWAERLTSEPKSRRS